VPQGLPRLLHWATLVATLALAGEASADCTCRALGRDFDLGRSVCMPTPTGFRLATCDMVLNNTSWRISSTPCVVASAADAAQQAASSVPTGRAHGHGHRH
jgi:hypothetical protein